jgi:NAD(P)-dependent dehydrogenase (short-subunit alcohol dehydrogenase family)
VDPVDHPHERLDGVGIHLLALETVRDLLADQEPAELTVSAGNCAQLSPSRAYVADVTDRARMAAVAAGVIADFGAVDIVVANAGIAIAGPFIDADAAEFDRVIEVNLLGSAATARAFLPALANSSGYFLQIASLAAMAPAPFMTAYCASKAGVEAFAHALRAEIADRGVRVGVAYLSWTDTDMVRGADADEVLGEFRHGLPWPLNRTAPVGAAVGRVVAGIARRSPRVYAPAWVRTVQWLPRWLVPALVALRAPVHVRRLADRLDATVLTRMAPVGPGGRAGSAAARSRRPQS